MPPIPMTEFTLSLEMANLKMDQYSFDLVSNDLPASTILIPACIYGDGHCLPRCASVLAYGSQEHYLEMRLGIILELVINQAYYLQNDSYSHGASHENHHSNFTTTFALFSDLYFDQHLTTTAIQRLFEEEVMAIRSEGSYMGVWQLASLANILGRPVMSVYPLYGGKTVRSDLHRIFYPQVVQQEERGYIMWTNTHGDSVPEIHWRPNHFVVLLPVSSGVNR